MAAAIWNPTIVQGETWIRTITITNSDGTAKSIASWTGSLVFRDTESGNTLLMLSLPSSGLSIGGSSNNVLTITASATQTEALPIGYCFFSLTLTDTTGNVNKWITGKPQVVVG